MTLRSFSLCVLLASLVVWVGASPVLPADSVPEETTLTADNLPNLRSKTFEGHRLDKLLTDRMIWMIKNHNLRITLQHSQRLSRDPRFAEATKKYDDSLRYDTKSKMLTGYQGGLPFSNVNPDRPADGWKVMYNNFYAAAEHRVQNYMNHLLTIDFENGLERHRIGAFQRYYYDGWLFGPPVRGEGVVHFKLLFMGLYPQDNRGNGFFNIRYRDGRIDDRWVYSRSLRRTRRTPNDSWKTLGKGGGAFLTNDSAGNMGHPTWYKNIRLLGRRTLLVPVRNPMDVVHPDASSADMRYQPVDLSIPPYWIPDPDVVRFEPRSVYVVEVEPPSDHVHGRSVIYVDTNLYLRYLREDYDHEGRLWHACIYSYTSKRGKRRNVKAWYVPNDFCVNFNNQSATHALADSKGVLFNQLDASKDDFSLKRLREGSPALSLPENWE